MVSDKRSGPPGGAGATREPRPVGARPGSINRGFASVDPERQREAELAGGTTAVEDGALAGHQRGSVPPGVPGRPAEARPPRARRTGGE